MKFDIERALQEFNEAEMAELLATLKKEEKLIQLQAATHECIRGAELESAPSDVRTAWTFFLARNPLHVSARAIVTMQALWGTRLHWKQIAQFLKRPGQGIFLGTHFSFKAPCPRKEIHENDDPSNPLS